MGGAQSDELLGHDLAVNGVQIQSVGGIVDIF